MSEKNLNVSHPLIKEKVVQPLQDFKQIREKYKIEKHRSTSKGNENPRSSTIKVDSAKNFNLNPFDPNKNPLSSIKASMFESAIWQS